jgi:hypothetical protein
MPCQIFVQRGNQFMTTSVTKFYASLYYSLFGWLVVDGWYWFVLREKYCWLVADG